MNCKICDHPVKAFASDKCTRSICGSCRTKIRRFRTKAAGIKLLGGKCNRCGFSGHQASFDFHHPNDDKEFTIGRVLHKAWKVVKEEMLKCELLCANCHREHHSNRDDERFLAVALIYKGTEFI